METTETNSPNKKRFYFYKSYWDIYKELNNLEDKNELIEIINKVQFLEVHVDNVKPSNYQIKLIYSSIKHSLETSVRGYCSRLGIEYDSYPWQGGYEGGSVAPCVDPSVEVVIKNKEIVIKNKKHPTLQEVDLYAATRNRSDIAKLFFDFYNENDWKDIHDTPVKNWKQKFITWESRNKPDKPERKERFV